MESFYVIQSEHNDLFYSKAMYYGTMDRWTSEQHMRPFETAREADAILNKMHPDYRARLKPHVMRARWVYCPKQKCDVLAVRMV